MKSVNIYKKQHRCSYKKNNNNIMYNRGIQCTVCCAALFLVALIGCGVIPGTADDDNGVPTEATQVQSVVSSAVSTNAITLNWNPPTDTAGYLGITISEENNSGSLSESVDISVDITMHTVTDLDPATDHIFTIATRYLNSGKNNTTTIAVTTDGFPTAVTQVQNARSSAITTSSITLNWDLPTDLRGYLGVTISEATNSGSVSDPVELGERITEYEVTDLDPAIDYIFIIATRYIDSGKNNTTTVAVTSGGVPTDDTKVQNVTRGAFSATSITLNWDLPTDLRGYLGVTISEETNSGSVSDPVDLGERITEYQVTGLGPSTNYAFTIATRYTDSGKDNSATIMAMTSEPVEVQSVVIDNDKTTSDSITLTWSNPQDAVDYTGVAITADPPVGSLTGTQTVLRGTNVLIISGLDAETTYTPTFTFVTEYDGGKNGSSSMHLLTVTTQSRRVTAVTVTEITEASVVLTWTPPEDSGGDYQGVTISAEPTIAVVVTVDEPSTTTMITGLTAATSYVFTITTRYSTANKNGGIHPIPTIQTLSINIIDRDGDTLVDINSLEDLNNVRYNLDLGATGDDGRYKNVTQTAHNAGLLCGDGSDIPCTGYELTRSLDFNDGGSYDSGMVDTDWRPNTADPAMATNAGWDPIGSCQTADTNDADIDACGDSDDTPFATRFEGNGYIIRNLYARNTTVNDGSGIGLFGITASTATIRSIGMQNVMLYGGRDRDRIGGIAGEHVGTIVGSYAHGNVTGATTSSSNIGGLVGRSSGTIIASYAAVAVKSNGANSNIGGLVGDSAGGTIIASYASGTVDGSTATSENIGGLVGHSNNPIVATYTSGAVNGIVGTDFIGGLGGSVSDVITASYAASDANGGTPGSLVGALVGIENRTNEASYGFGSVTNALFPGSDGTAKPTVDGMVGSAAITSATQLTLDNAGTIWNDADSDTLNAWDFGTTTQSPALRYADYDGTENDDYHCGDNNKFTGIPTVVASPSGPLPVNCSTTLLPGQEGR